MKITTLLLLLAATIAAKAQYANSVYLNYQESLSTSGDVLITDMSVSESTYATFYAAITWSTGYLGIQSEGGTGYVRHVHYSVFDPPSGGEADLVWTNNGVVAQRFGGEGTGWEITWPYNWTTNTFYRYCVSVTNVLTNSYFTGYFFDPNTGVWTPIATVVRHDGPLSFSYSSSFIEDFGETPTNARSAYFGNCWMNTNFSALTGWIELKTALFQAVNALPTNYDAGVYGKLFWMATGGDTTNVTPSNTILVRETAVNPPNIVTMMATKLGGEFNMTWPTTPLNEYQIEWTSNLVEWPPTQTQVTTSNTWNSDIGASSQFFNLLITTNFP